MQQDLATLIRTTAAQVRARDFLWSTAIFAGIALVIAIAGYAPFWLMALSWAAYLVALGVRFRFSSGREWAMPVERVINNEIAAQELELGSLRLAQGVAEALPEPLFILDAKGLIEHANPAALEFVGTEDLHGRHFAAAIRAPEVYEAAEAIVKGGEARVVEFTTFGAVERVCRAFVAPLADGSPQVDGPAVDRTMLYIRDLTSERRVDQMRADFVASASHELRTPLASLLGFIETLRGRAKNDEEARVRFLEIMQTQAERMQRLIHDLMSLSRIELNEHVPPHDSVDLAATTADVLDQLRPLLTQAEAIVDFDADPDTRAQIVGDKDEITQAVQNLIDNARKYGGDPAMIKIAVGRGPAPTLSVDGEVAYRTGDSAGQLAARLKLDPAQLVYIQVRDFGAGIERNDLPRLTERFYRVSVERSRKVGGTGLGLAIVKHITNRHMGGLQIESLPAVGTTFTCYFPPAN